MWQRNQLPIEDLDVAERNRFVRFTDAERRVVVQEQCRFVIADPRRELGAPERGSQEGPRIGGDAWKS